MRIIALLTLLSTLSISEAFADDLCLPAEIHNTAHAQEICSPQCGSKGWNGGWRHYSGQSNSGYDCKSVCGCKGPIPRDYQPRA